VVPCWRHVRLGRKGCYPTSVCTAAKLRASKRQFKHSRSRYAPTVARIRWQSGAPQLTNVFEMPQPQRLPNALALMCRKGVCFVTHGHSTHHNGAGLHSTMAPPSRTRWMVELLLGPMPLFSCLTNGRHCGAKSQPLELPSTLPPSRRVEADGSGLRASALLSRV
jgi:hypothetical protein